MLAVRADASRVPVGDRWLMSTARSTLLHTPASHRFDHLAAATRTRLPSTITSWAGARTKAFLPYLRASGEGCVNIPRGSRSSASRSGAYNASRRGARLHDALLMELE